MIALPGHNDRSLEAQKDADGANSMELIFTAGILQTAHWDDKGNLPLSI